MPSGRHASVSTEHFRGRSTGEAIDRNCLGPASEKAAPGSAIPVVAATQPRNSSIRKESDQLREHGADEVHEPLSATRSEAGASRPSPFKSRQRKTALSHAGTVSWPYCRRAFRTVVLVFIGLLSTVGIAIRGNAETAFRGLLNALVLIFIIYPVLLRMMMDKDFKGFVLEIVRPEGGEGELTLAYPESLRAGWLLIWRSTALSVLCGAIPGFIIGIVGYLLGTSESAIQVVALFLLAPIHIFLVTPWVVRMMMRKQFRGFRLQIVRPDTNNQ